MTSISPLPNHKFWPSGQGSALLAIDTGFNPEENHDPHIHMRFPASPTGRVQLGSFPGPTCVILKVAAHETFSVISRYAGRMSRQSFEVLPGLKLQQSQNSHSALLEIDEKDLEALFSTDWPEWLRPALEAQLRYWRIHHLEHYYRYTPWEMSGDDLWRCIKGTPSQALRRFGHLLTESQRRLCCKKDPRAAAAFSLETLCRVTRRRALDEYPEDVLRHAAHHLTDSELVHLGATKPLPVFRFYGCLLERQKALALSSALKQGRSTFQRPALSREFLLGSLVEFPEQWLAGAGPELEDVLMVLNTQCGLITNWTELMEIHGRLEPDRQPTFVRVIVQRI